LNDRFYFIVHNDSPNNSIVRKVIFMKKLEVKNMDQEEIVNEWQKIVADNELQKVNEGLYLSKFQQQVLDDYHIPYSECTSVRDVLFLLEDLDEDSYEFEEVARQLAEYSYYEEYHR